MDLSNASVQAALVEEFYLVLLSYFDSENGGDRSKMVVNINESLYGLVQSPLYCYNCFKGTFEVRGFKPSPLDTFMFYVRGMVVLIYVENVLFFVTDQYDIYEVIKLLEDADISLTVE